MLHSRLSRSTAVTDGANLLLSAPIAPKGSPLILPLELLLVVTNPTVANARAIACRHHIFDELLCDHRKHPSFPPPLTACVANNPTQLSLMSERNGSSFQPKHYQSREPFRTFNHPSYNPSPRRLPVMRSVRWIVLVALAASLSSVAQNKESALPPTTTIIRAGVLIDGKSDTPRRDRSSSSAATASRASQRRPAPNLRPARRSSTFPTRPWSPD